MTDPLNLADYEVLTKIFYYGKYTGPVDYTSIIEKNIMNGNLILISKQDIDIPNIYFYTRCMVEVSFKGIWMMFVCEEKLSLEVRHLTRENIRKVGNRLESYVNRLENSFRSDLQYSTSIDY